jgi:hypothetical protein
MRAPGGKEETGYTLTSWRYRGIVTFVSGKGSMEYMSLFTADGFEGTEAPCDEGELEWVDIEKVWKLNLWAGDKIFFRLLDEQDPFFSLKLVYDAADVLKTASLNGKPMELFDVWMRTETRPGQYRSAVWCTEKATGTEPRISGLPEERKQAGTGNFFCRKEAWRRIPILEDMIFRPRGTSPRGKKEYRLLCGN